MAFEDEALDLSRDQSDEEESNGGEQGLERGMADLLLDEE